MTRHDVLVLGGGISGTLTACLLHDRGVDVAIVDAAARLVDRASRWNDGKIHLGYTFMGTPSMATARLMQQGAAAFVPLLEQVTGGSLPADAWGHPLLYVVDERSLVDADEVWRRAQRVAALLETSAAQDPGLGRYLPAGEPAVTRLTAAEATTITGQDRISGGFRTTELHISPAVVADRLRAAVADRGIPVIRARVVRVAPGPRPAAPDAWSAVAEDGTTLRARVLVNATWSDRERLDRLVRGTREAVSIRYKLCLLGRWPTDRPLPTPITRIVGGFGDIVTYRDGHAYLSWYPTALIARSDDGLPPTPPSVDHKVIIRDTLAGLGQPPELATATRWEVGGGYVVAHGPGDVWDPTSAIHERHRPTVAEPAPGFISVDTGKYTLGPLFARRAARLVADRIGLPAQAEP